MDWLKASGFQQNLNIHLGRDFKQIDFPDFAKFMIWLGYMCRKTQLENYRMVTAVLVPTRISCAAFAGIGAIAAALKEDKSFLSWEKFIKLENSERIFFIHPGKDGKIERLEGEVGELMLNGTMRKVKIISKLKRHKDLQITMSKGSFEKREVSLEPFQNNRGLKAVNQVGRFFSGSMIGIEGKNLFLQDNETLIVTQKARFAREMESLNFSYGNSKEKFEFDELIMTQFSRTIIRTPKSIDLHTIECPLAILDGLEALRALENIGKTQNVLILIENSEFNDECQNRISELALHCSKEKPDQMPLLPCIKNFRFNTEFYLFQS